MSYKIHGSCGCTYIKPNYVGMACSQKILIVYLYSININVDTRTTVCSTSSFD